MRHFLRFRIRMKKCVWHRRARNCGDIDTILWRGAVHILRRLWFSWSKKGFPTSVPCRASLILSVVIPNSSCRNLSTKNDHQYLDYTQKISYAVRPPPAWTKGGKPTLNMMPLIVVIAARAASQRSRNDIILSGKYGSSIIIRLIFPVGAGRLNMNCSEFSWRVASREDTRRQLAWWNLRDDLPPN